LDWFQVKSITNWLFYSIRNIEQRYRRTDGRADRHDDANSQSYCIKLATLAHECVNGHSREYLAEFCHPSIGRRPGMRSADSGKLHVPCARTPFW